MVPVDNGLRTLWLTSVALTTKATGGIHKLEAPQSVVTPHLVYRSLDDAPRYTFGARPRLDASYELRGVGMASASQGAAEVAEAIRDLAVQVATGRSGSTWTLTVTGYTVRRVFWVRNLTPFTEVSAGGVLWVHAPAHLQLWLNPS